MRMIITKKFHGHAGRPGEVGGSLPRGQRRPPQKQYEVELTYIGGKTILIRASSQEEAEEKASEWASNAPVLESGNWIAENVIEIPRESESRSKKEAEEDYYDDVIWN